MKFFEDFKISKDSSIGITNLLSNITTREGSHKGGWARLLKCQLINAGYSNVRILDNRDFLNNYDVIIFDLGAEYSGSLNLFGGLDEKVYARLKQIEKFRGTFFSWKHELPSCGVLSGRKHNESTCLQFKNEGDNFLISVTDTLSKAQKFDHVYRTSSILIGDSHTPSVWTPEFMIERRDGRTLKGMIDNKTIKKYVDLFRIELGMELSKIQVHCSSIDIRHHVCREPDPENYVYNLSLGLIHDLTQVSDARLIATHTMGIEDESRELPKTGYFKGTPFFGSWDQRNKVRTIFNSRIDGLTKIDHDSEVIKFPEYFFDESGKLKFEVMEKPGSVHLSPEHYRWDLDNNRDRWIHEEGR